MLTKEYSKIFYLFLEYADIRYIDNLEIYIGGFNMDVSRIGGFRYTVNNIKLHTSVNNATSHISEKIFVNDKIEAIEPGCLKLVDEKKNVYYSYVSEYGRGMTNGQGNAGRFSGLTLS